MKLRKREAEVEITDCVSSLMTMMHLQVFLLASLPLFLSSHECTGHTPSYNAVELEMNS